MKPIFIQTGTAFLLAGTALIAASVGCKKAVEYSNPVGLSSPTGYSTPAVTGPGGNTATAPGAPSGPSTAESQRMNQTYLNAYGKSGSTAGDPNSLKQYQERAQGAPAAK